MAATRTISEKQRLADIREAQAAQPAADKARYVILPDLPLDVYEMPDADTHALIAECPSVVQAKQVLTALNQAAAVDALVESVNALLKAEDCPNCPDQGWYADGPTDDPEQVQCEWCECVESSLFKAKAKVAAAVEQLKGRV